MTPSAEAKPEPGREDAEPGAVPPYGQALSHNRDRTRQGLIMSVLAGDDGRWDTWKATIAFCHRATFADLLEFFVNLPSLADTFDEDGQMAAWQWQEIAPVTLDSYFSHRPELIGLLRARAGADALIIEGWQIQIGTGRIDAETTWAENAYLFATKGYFAFIHLYQETIH